MAIPSQAVTPTASSRDSSQQLYRNEVDNDDMIIDYHRDNNDDEGKRERWLSSIDSTPTLALSLQLC